MAARGCVAGGNSVVVVTRLLAVPTPVLQALALAFLLALALVDASRWLAAFRLRFRLRSRAAAAERAREKELATAREQAMSAMKALSALHETEVSIHAGPSRGHVYRVHAVYLQGL